MPLPLDCHPRGRPTFGSVAALLLGFGNALQFLPEYASSFGAPGEAAREGARSTCWPDIAAVLARRGQREQWLRSRRRRNLPGEDVRWRRTRRRCPSTGPSRSTSRTRGRDPEEWPREQRAVERPLHRREGLAVRVEDRPGLARLAPDPDGLGLRSRSRRDREVSRPVPALIADRAQRGEILQRQPEARSNCRHQECCASWTRTQALSPKWHDGNKLRRVAKARSGKQLTSNLETTQRRPPPSYDAHLTRCVMTFQ